MGDMIVRERRGEERKARTAVWVSEWVVRRLFPLMRASGGQTIRCGESRKKEAEVEGRSFDTESERERVPVSQACHDRVIVCRVRPAI